MDELIIKKIGGFWTVNDKRLRDCTSYEQNLLANFIKSLDNEETFIIDRCTAVISN